MAHKQDRHQCSILLNLKLFLSDIQNWRVNITGSHVPPDCGTLWQPPPPGKQRLDEDMRDLIVSYVEGANTSQIINILSQKHTQKKSAVNKKRVLHFVSSMKKRRRQRDYNYVDTLQQDVDETSGTRPWGKGIKTGLGVGSKVGRGFGPLAGLGAGRASDTRIELGNGAENTMVVAGESSTHDQIVGSQINVFENSSLVSPALSIPSSSVACLPAGYSHVLLADNQHIVVMHAEDSTSELVGLYEMIGSDSGVIKLQTMPPTGHRTPGSVPVSRRMPDQGVGIPSRVMLQTGDTVRTQGQAVVQPLALGPSSRAVTELTQDQTNTYIEVEVQPSPAVQDGNNLQDLGALLWAACQQK